MVRKHTNRKSNASKLKNAAAKRAAGSGKSAGRKFKIQIPATEERTLPPECSRLGVFGWHDDISGPDAEVVHCFKLTRNELISLGYHYLDRFFSVKRRHRVQCEQSTWEWIEVIFAAKRFCSIERTLSPGRLIGDFQTYINSQWLGIDNLHQAIARKGGKTHAYIDPISTMSIAILPEDEPENRSRRDRRKKDLSEECDGLPFDYCCHEGVDGPDAELVHFPPTRRELKLLAAQYLERRFS